MGVDLLQLALATLEKHKYNRINELASMSVGPTDSVSTKYEHERNEENEVIPSRERTPDCAHQVALPAEVEAVSARLSTEEPGWCVVTLAALNGGRVVVVREVPRPESIPPEAAALPRYTLPELEKFALAAQPEGAAMLRALHELRRLGPAEGWEVTSVTPRQTSSDHVRARQEERRGPAHFRRGDISARALLRELDQRGVKVSVVGDEIHVAPVAALDRALLREVWRFKHSLMRLVAAPAENSTPVNYGEATTPAWCGTCGAALAPYVFDLAGRPALLCPDCHRWTYAGGGT
jgi:hypothetical protein